MDISLTNVLKGVGQYFQNLPAASSTTGGGKHRQSAPQSENDGSVRSEQHSAVPVYWDQQNQGQAAANLTNRDAPLTMSQQPQQHQQHLPAGGGARAALHPSQMHSSGFRYAVSNGSKNDGGPSTAQHNLYPSHISSVPMPTDNKTYYELQTSNNRQSAKAPQALAQKSDVNRMYSSYPLSNSAPSHVQLPYYPPSSSSSQEPMYNYKYNSSQPARQIPNQHYSSNYYPAGSSQTPQHSQSLQTQPQHSLPQNSRRHLPVQPSNMYPYPSRNTGSGNTKLQNSNILKTPAYNVPANANKSNASNFNGPQQNLGYPSYYPNGNYTPSSTYATNSSTVSRPTYVNTPHPTSVSNYPSRPMKSQADECAPSPSPATAVPAARVPIPKMKRESPLDLSVKTVRTSADSTLVDDERHYRSASSYDLPQHSSQYMARAPKVDFSPNFAMQPEVIQPSVQHQHPQQPHSQLQHGHMQQLPPQNASGHHAKQQHNSSNNYYNYSYSTSTLPKIEFDFQQRKRSFEHAVPAAVPEKIPKKDTWRQKMDLQIEQRLNSYSKPRQEAKNNDIAAPSVIANSSVPSLPHYAQQQQPPPPHSQSYGSYYNSGHVNNVLSTKPHVKEVNSTKSPATKKVLNLLRTSLQNKAGKPVISKLPPDPPVRGYLEREILQPSTDVMAPLQPKPGIVGRRNVSPFTAVSLERNSNTPPTYKFHIPKAIDSVIISDEGEKEQEASMGSDLDGLAAFLAARIRTKAELKQVTTNENRTTTRIPAGNSNGTLSSSPKLEPSVSTSQVVIPKKLFGRNEMKRSEVRSSSETSVFDFPDSDNETDMPVLERQSLLNMRKDRKVTPNSKQASQTSDVAMEADATDNERPASPFSLLFNQTCDSFVEQLMGGTGKKRGRRKKTVEPSSENDKVIPIEIKKEMIEDEVLPVVVKQEPVEVPEIDTMETVGHLKINSEPVKPEEIITEFKSEIALVPPAPPPIEADVKHTDTDSDTPLVHIATKQKKKFIKKESKINTINEKLQKSKTKKEEKDDKLNDGSDSEVEKLSRSSKSSSQKDFYDSLKAPITICKPGKKPTFGDGSDFGPGWEDALYRYKKSIRMPMQLIQVTRPPSSQRLSTSLPDLDPCPISPAPKTESIDSDMDSSNCSFSFSKHYDSDQGSMKSFSSKCSILDKLIERVGAKKKKRLRKEDPLGPKIIPKSENELLPTPSLEIKDVVIKSTSALLSFRKKTVDNFKGAFINNSNKIVGVNAFNTVVLKARTRTETRVLKEKATIREVFGEDRPASAPPVTCVDEFQPDVPSKVDKENQLKKEFNDVLIKAIENKKLEINVESIKKEKDDDSITVISTDSVETGSGRKRNKLRRKLSSGFDYIRKKKKQIKKEEGADDVQVKSKRRGILFKATPESVDDIQKEIKQWVLNKGVGETHLHRASRSGYTDITAYCLEKMMCNPSPRDNAGYTPLHEACSKGHLDIARLLLQYGAHVSESATGGIRPLHEAAENGYVEIIRLLLSYGADPSLATYSGTTPLQLANDDLTIAVLQDHLNELHGKSNIAWKFSGPASIFDGDNEGFDPLSDVPEADPQPEAEDIDFEVSENLLPNLYILPNCEASDRWVILQDLSNALKIKSKETLLRQLNISSPSKSDLVKEMKMCDFLENAHCCQFMNANEKLNTRLSKILFAKYTDKVKQLLNVEEIKFTNAIKDGTR